MSRPLSPIERMIDVATGYGADNIRPRIITMRCPGCNKEKAVPRHWIDPPRAALVVFPCLEHTNGTEIPIYREADGTVVPL